MRQHDSDEAKAAHAQGLKARARTQNEATSSRKRRSVQIRQAEQARQWDRQREEIHPAEVFEHVTTLTHKKTKVAPLPPAVPDADPDRASRVLPVRTMREEPQP